LNYFCLALLIKQRRFTYVDSSNMTRTSLLKPQRLPRKTKLLYW